MAKKKAVKTVYDLVRDLEAQMLSSYKRWKTLFTTGGSDPSWSDGVNLNLVRNHINYYKRQIEELLLGRFIDYPDTYWYPEPKVVPQNFSVTDRTTMQGEVLTANKTLKYNDVMKFNWEEVM